MFNQFGQYMPGYGMPAMQNAQRLEIIKVNGRAGAEALQMLPNSEALMLDTSGPIVWLKTTDGAGYATCTPYTITPYEPAPEISTGDLLARIERLEGMINDKSNTTGAKRSKAADTEQQ